LKFIEYDSLGSTNIEADRLFEGGEAAPFWVRADAQTQGRGRRGRDWVSPKGNFYGTAVYRFDGEPQDAAKLSFVAAIAVANALSAYTLKTAPTLKWPNDVLLDGRKVAGLLLEAKPGRVLIGIGVNLVSRPSAKAARKRSVARGVRGWHGKGRPCGRCLFWGLRNATRDR